MAKEGYGCFSLIMKTLRFIILTLGFIVFGVVIFCVLIIKLPNYYKDELVTGNSLAICGNRIAIGCSGVLSSAGYIVIMEKEGEKWKQTALIETNGLLRGYRGPYCIAMSEKYLAVSYDHIDEKPGAVQIYYRDSNYEWKKGRVIYSPDKKRNRADRFGSALSLYGNQLLVGAERAGFDESGKAYLYKLDNGSITLCDEFAAPENGKNFSFSKYVYIEKDEIIISDNFFNFPLNRQYENKTYKIIDENGKSHWETEVNPNKKALGKIYFYKSDGNKYVLERDIAAEDFAKYETVSQFGIAFVKDGNILIASAPRHIFAFDLNTNMKMPFWSYRHKYYGLFETFEADPDCTVFSYNNNNLVISSSLYKLNDGEFNLVDDLSTYSKSDTGSFGNLSCISNDLILCLDYLMSDDYEERKQQHRNITPLDPAVNQGRVHIIRLLPDHGYVEEACIARRESPKGGIEFYDMLEK